jgi:hypothetical protein
MPKALLYVVVQLLLLTTDQTQGDHMEPAPVEVKVVIDHRGEKRPSMPTPGAIVAMGAVGAGKYHPSISLDPRNVEGIDGFEEFKGYLAPAQNAFSIATEGLKKIHTAREFADRNGAWNEAAKLLNVAAAAERKQEQMTRAFDAATRDLSNAVKAIELSLSAPVEAGAIGSLAAEIRSHVRSLSSDDRRKFMHDAMDRGDLKTLSACLGGPSYLSGLSDEMQKTFVRLYHEKASPELARRLRATQTALTMVEERGPLVWSQVERAMGGKFSLVAKLRAANSEAEKALLMNDDAA